MNVKRKILFLFVFLLVFMLIPQFSSGADKAKYAGEFMAIGVGGRALGLGGAYCALAADVSAGYWNPAGLSRIIYPEVTLMHDERFGNLVNYDYGAFAVPIGLNTSIALSIIRLGIDGIPDTRKALIDINGNGRFDETDRLDYSKITFFNSADWAIYFSYSKKTNDVFSYGINLKFIRRELGEFSATGVGFDVGAQYNLAEKVIVGANFQDVTTTFLAWSNGTEELIVPTLKIGSAYYLDALGGQLAPTFDVDFRFEGRKTSANANIGDVSLDFHTGLEFEYKNLIALRAGYSDIGSINFGSGIRLPKFNIDYSFSKFNKVEELGNTHRISLTFILQAEQFARQSGL